MSETTSTALDRETHLGASWRAISMAIAHSTHQHFTVCEFQLEIFWPVKFITWWNSICTGSNRLQCRCWGALNSIPDWTGQLISSLPSWGLRMTTNRGCTSTWTLLRCPTFFIGIGRLKTEGGRVKKQLSCTQGQRPSRKTRWPQRPIQLAFPAAHPLRCLSIYVSETKNWIIRTLTSTDTIKTLQIAKKQLIQNILLRYLSYFALSLFAFGTPEYINSYSYNKTHALFQVFTINHKFENLIWKKSGNCGYRKDDKYRHLRPPK